MRTGKSNVFTQSARFRGGSPCGFPYRKVFRKALCSSAGTSVKLANISSLIKGSRTSVSRISRGHLDMQE